MYKFIDNKTRLVKHVKMIKSEVKIDINILIVNKIFKQRLFEVGSESCIMRI
jgi:hypothetical protein